MDNETSNVRHIKIAQKIVTNIKIAQNLREEIVTNIKLEQTFKSVLVSIFLLYNIFGTNFF